MAYLLFLNLVMLTRLGYLTRETPSPALIWVPCAVQLAGLSLFAFSPSLLALGGVLLLAALLNHWLEASGRSLTGSRALCLLLIAAAAALLPQPLALAGWSQQLLAWLGSATLWTRGLDAEDWQRANAILLGLLLLGNEVNLLIRYTLHKLDLEPRFEDQADDAERLDRTDQQAYNAGRVIGILERYFILILLAAGADFAAVAAILAAKGFARFKQLERRAFAEYILIGTLSSALAAVLVALLVRRLMGA